MGNAMNSLGMTLDGTVDELSYWQGTPDLRPMSDFAPADVPWLWPHVIPVGKITLVIGDPGVGKTFFALDVAARVSQGDPWPDDPPLAPLPRPAEVLLVSAEDNPRDTLAPRLEAQAADLERITCLAGIDSQEGRRRRRWRFSLVAAIEKLEEILQKVGGCRLIIIDPLGPYLHGVNANRHAEAYGLLAPLADVAERYKVAVLAVNHLNKNLGGPLIHRSLGSLAFAAAARAVWAIVRDPHDRERRILMPVKNNLARDAHALAFRLVQHDGFRAPAICWEDQRIDLPVLPPPRERQPRPKSPRQFPRRALAIEWLERQLASGQCPSKELLNSARLENIAEKTLRRALQELGGATRKAPEGHWVWALPAPQPADPPPTPSVEPAPHGTAPLVPRDDVANMAKLIQHVNP